MLNKIRAVLRVIAEYMMENPGAASLALGYLTLALARIGLHVDEAQLAAIFAALLPLVVGIHVGARKARAVRAAKSTSNEA